MAGYVYLIGTPVFGWYKIGKSITPEVRIKDLGILLPFKIHVMGVWAAANHHLMETTLHEMYADCRINGEWFEFTKKSVYDVFNKIPSETRIYPVEGINHAFDKFSNITGDTKNDRAIIGVRVRRGTQSEEELKEQGKYYKHHKTVIKTLRKLKGYTERKYPFVIICDTVGKPRINIFTSII